MRKRTQLASALRVAASQENHDGEPWGTMIEAAVQLDQDDLLIQSMRKLLDETVPMLRLRIEKLQKALDLSARDRLFEKLQDRYPGKAVGFVIRNGAVPDGDSYLEIEIEGVGKVKASTQHPSPDDAPEWFEMVCYELDFALSEREQRTNRKKR